MPTKSTLSDVLNDPDFHKLDPTDQKAALGNLFPDYKQLSPEDQDAVLGPGTRPTQSTTTKSNLKGLLRDFSVSDIADFVPANTQTSLTNRLSRGPIVSSPSTTSQAAQEPSTFGMPLPVGVVPEELRGATEDEILTRAQSNRVPGAHYTVPITPQELNYARSQIEQEHEGTLKLKNPGATAVDVSGYAGWGKMGTALHETGTKGIADFGEGAMEAGQPLLALGAATAPAATAKALFAGTVGSIASEQLAKKAGASEDTQRIASILGGLLGGSIGGGPEIYGRVRARLVENVSKDFIAKGVEPVKAAQFADHAVSMYEATGDATHIGAPNAEAPSAGKVIKTQARTAAELAQASLIGGHQEEETKGGFSADKVDLSSLPEAAPWTPPPGKGGRPLDLTQTKVLTPIPAEKYDFRTGQGAGAKDIGEQVREGKPELPRDRRERVRTPEELADNALWMQARQELGDTKEKLADLSYEQVKAKVEELRAAKGQPTPSAQEPPLASTTTPRTMDEAIRTGNSTYGRGKYVIRQAGDSFTVTAKPTPKIATVPVPDAATHQAALGQYQDSLRALDLANRKGLPDVEISKAKQEVTIARNKYLDKYDAYVKSLPEEDARRLVANTEEEARGAIDKVQTMRNLLVRNSVGRTLAETLKGEDLTPKQRDLTHELLGETEFRPRIRELQFIPKGEAGERMKTRIADSQAEIRASAEGISDPVEKQRMLDLATKNVIITIERATGAPKLVDGKIELPGKFSRLDLRTLQTILGKKIQSKFGKAKGLDKEHLVALHKAIEDAPNADLQVKARGELRAFQEQLHQKYLKGIYEQLLNDATWKTNLAERSHRVRGSQLDSTLVSKLRAASDVGSMKDVATQLARRAQEVIQSTKESEKAPNFDRLQLEAGTPPKVDSAAPADIVPQTGEQAEVLAHNKKLLEVRRPAAQQKVEEILSQIRASKNFLEQQKLGGALEKAIGERDLVETLATKAEADPTTKHTLKPAEVAEIRKGATKKAIDAINQKSDPGLGRRGAFKTPEGRERGSLSFRPAQKSVGDTTFEKIQQVREDAKKLKKPGIIERLTNLPDQTITHFYDMFADIPGSDSAAAQLAHPELKGAITRVEQQTGQRVTEETNPYIRARMAYGGGGGAIRAAGLEYRSVLNEARKAGLEDRLTAYLDAKGYDRALRTVEEHRTEAAARLQTAKTEYNQIAADVKAGKRTPKSALDDMKRAKAERQQAKDDLKDATEKLRSKTVVPEKLDRPEIAAKLVSMERQWGPDNWAHVEKLAQQVFDLNRQAWDAAHSEGVISDAVYQQGIARGNDYIPLHRIQDIVNLSNRRFGGKSLQLRQQNILKSLAGSERVNINPIEDSFSQYGETMREISRNSVARTLIQFAENDPDGFGGLIKEVPKGYKPGPGEGTIGYYRNGEPVTYKVPDYIAGILNNVTPMDMGMLDKALLFFKKPFQLGTTLANPAFALANAIRDIQSALTVSKTAPGFNPIEYPRFMGQWFQSLKESIAGDKPYLDFLRAEGGFATLQQNITPEHFVQFRKPFERWYNPVNIIRNIEDVNSAIEEATKLTVFKRARARGMTDRAAAWETRNMGGSPDFAKRGTTSASINMLAMFFNANVQGIGRTMKWAMKNPKRLTAFLGITAAATLALLRHNAQFTDEQGEPLWDRISDNDKQNYFIILHKGPNGESTYQTDQGASVPFYWKIPKSHEARFFFNPTEEALSRTFFASHISGTQVGLNALSNVLPGSYNLKQGQVAETFGRGLVSSANPIVREPFEQGMNYDSFRGTPIVPRRLQDVAPAYQTTPATSPTASLAGKAIGVSPMRVEHAVQGFGGGLAQQVLQLTDTVVRKVTGKPTPTFQGDQAVSRTPIIGSIAGRFVGSPMDQREKTLEENFYTAATDVQEKKATFDRLKKTAKPAEVLNYFRENKDALVKVDTILAVQKSISSLRDIQERIQNSNQTPEQKAATIRTLYNTRIRIFTIANKALFKK